MPSISYLFARNYQGGPFILFGPAHLIGLAIVVAVCLGILLARKRFSPTAQRNTRWGLLVLIYLCEGSWQIWMLVTGQWTIQGMLPLWLCSVTSWTMPLLLIVRSRRYYEWAYYMGIIGASMALLTPDLMNYGFPHFRFIEFFMLHGTVIVAVVYMTVVERFRPTWRSLAPVIIITNLYWLFCAGVNHLIGSNYLYTQGKLPTPSLLDILGPYPWYLLSMEGLGILLCLLLFLPFAIKDWRNRPAGIRHKITKHLPLED
jgi:hypothetical integral membrane protein (TIGR02206 family)